MADQSARAPLSQVQAASEDSPEQMEAHKEDQLPLTRVMFSLNSWQDPELVRSGKFFPPFIKDPMERLKYYSQRFGSVELDGTNYAMPFHEGTRKWAQHSTKRFLFHMKAFQMFTWRQCETGAMPRYLRERLPASLQNEAKVTWAELPVELQTLMWQRWNDALAPLHEAGKLGVTVFQFTPDFAPTNENFKWIEKCRGWLSAPYEMAVEFRNPLWFHDAAPPGELTMLQKTLAFLRGKRVGLVIFDEPGWLLADRQLQTTHPYFSYIRVHRRGDGTVDKQLNAAEIKAWTERLPILMSRMDDLYKEHLQQEEGNPTGSLPESIATQADTETPASPTPQRKAEDREPAPPTAATATTPAALQQRRTPFGYSHPVVFFNWNTNASNHTILNLARLSEKLDSRIIIHSLQQMEVSAPSSMLQFLKRPGAHTMQKAAAAVPYSDALSSSSDGKLSPASISPYTPLAPLLPGGQEFSWLPPQQMSAQSSPSSSESSKTNSPARAASSPRKQPESPSRARTLSFSATAPAAAPTVIVLDETTPGISTDTTPSFVPASTAPATTAATRPAQSSSSSPSRSPARTSMAKPSSPASRSKMSKRAGAPEQQDDRPEKKQRSLHDFFAK